MTAKRLQRVQTVLAQRQLDVTVALDQVHKMHNLSAIIRSCDATGVPTVHAVELEASLRTFKTAAAGSQDWVKLYPYQSSNEMIQTVKAKGMTVYAAHLSDQSVDFRDIDYTKPCCILMGAEKAGVSDQAAKLADQHIIIPMLGMVESLNVSVAAATILYEIQRQRQAAGMYQQCQYNDVQLEKLVFEWMQPKMARYYHDKGLPYPTLDDEGDIVF